MTLRCCLRGSLRTSSKTFWTSPTGPGRLASETSPGLSETRPSETSPGLSETRPELSEIRRELMAAVAYLGGHALSWARGFGVDGAWRGSDARYEGVSGGVREGRPMVRTHCGLRRNRDGRDYADSASSGGGGAARKTPRTR